MQRIISAPAAVLSVNAALAVCALLVPARGWAADAASPAAQLQAALDHWRTVSAFRTETTYKVWFMLSALRGAGGAAPLQHGRDSPIDLSAKASFVAAGRKYRMSQEYTDCKALPRAAEMSFDVAYDGKLFEFFKRVPSVLEYGTEERVGKLQLMVLSATLAPYQFLCAGTAGPRVSDDDDRVLWPQVLDEKWVRARLAKGIPGTVNTKAGTRPTLSFVGGKRHGEAVTYRVYTDGPGGQPSQIDYVNGGGVTVADDSFEYATPAGAGAWPVVRKMTSASYPGGGKVTFRMSADVTTVDLAPALADDEFSIDFTSANNVIDMDAGKTVADLESQATGVAPPTKQPPKGK